MIKEISKELNNFNVAPTIHQNVIVVLFFERWQAARLGSWHFNKRWNSKHATQALKSVHWRILKYKMENMPCRKHPLPVHMFQSKLSNPTTVLDFQRASNAKLINWDYPVLLLSWSFSACVCLSRKRSSFLQEQDPTAEQSFHTLSILNPHNQEMMEEDETDIQAWLTFKCRISDCSCHEIIFRAGSE